MAPNIRDFLLEENEAEKFHKTDRPKTAAPRQYEIVWANVITFLYWYIAAVYGLYLCFTSVRWPTIVFAYILYVLGNIGIMGGAHRLWSHRSFKAKLPLEILLMVFNSLAYQYTASYWARDHRLHHKYSDTDADPHNASRGFFYSHIGWLLVKKHPEVLKRGKGIDVSDLENNPVLNFQKRYAIPFIGTVCFLLPTLIPMYLWGESFSNAWHTNILRYMVNLNVTFLVNSAAHMWGNRPYDKTMLPSQNKSVTVLTLGEGFHNYHHTFPWDYRASELGSKLNFTTMFIDFFVWVGWAYDVKTTSTKMIVDRSKRTGDGSDIFAKFVEEEKGPE